MEEQTQQQPTPQPEKPQKRVYKKWWFWFIIILILICLFIFSLTDVMDKMDKYVCEAQGDKWGEVGMPRGEPYCIDVADDAGQSCADSSECKGQCYQLQSKEYPEGIGECSDYFRSNAYREVINGNVGELQRIFVD